MSQSPADRPIPEPRAPGDSTSRTHPRPPRGGWRALLPWALVAVAVGLWFVGRSDGSRLDDGTAAPELVVPWTGEGEQFSLRSERGHVVVLSFWATWCGACRNEAPVLERVSGQIQDAGDRVVGISVDDAPLGQVASLAQRLGMGFPIGLATREDAERFGVTYLPTIYVIDPQGGIAESFSGPTPERTIIEAVERARAM